MGLFTAKGLIGTKKQAPPNAMPVNKVPYDERIVRLDALRMDLKAFLPPSSYKGNEIPHCRLSAWY
jgi:hypothetical protein